MNRPFFLSLGAAALAATAALAFAPAPVFKEPPKPKVPELVSAIQGTWQLEQNPAIAGRVAFARRVAVQQQIRIQGNSWGYINVFNGTEQESTKYEMVLDAAAAPATLDLKYDTAMQMKMLGGGGFGGAAPAQQFVMKGIVKVEGDTLTYTYVYGFNAGERPRSFGSNALPNGGVSQTMTLKRVR